MPTTDCIIREESFEERRYKLLSVYPTIENHHMHLFSWAFDDLLSDVKQEGPRYKALYKILKEEYKAMKLYLY